MSLKNGTANGKSHTHTAGFRGVERVKDLRYRVRIKTYPGVFYRYLHLVRVNVPGGDHQFSRPLTYTAHRFNTIHDQVQYHLLQPHLIAENRKNVVRKPRSDHHAVPFRLVADEGEDFPDGLIQVQLFSRNLSLSCQGPNPSDHFSGSLPVADDPTGGFPGFFHVGRISGQPTQASAGVTHHARQRLVDFMRDRGGQFTQYAYPVDVSEICLELPQLFALFFGLHAVTDVPGNLQQEATPPIRNQAGVYFDREQRPVLSPMPVSVKCGLTRHRLLRDCFNLRSIRIQMEGKRCLADQLLPSVPKTVAGGPIQINDGFMLEVQNEEGVACVVHKSAKARLALAQSLLSTFALCDIDGCTHNFNKLSIGIQNGMAYGMDVFEGSIR